MQGHGNLSSPCTPSHHSHPQRFGGIQLLVPLEQVVKVGYEPGQTNSDGTSVMDPLTLASNFHLEQGDVCGLLFEEEQAQTDVWSMSAHLQNNNGCVSRVHVLLRK